ncbi:MAG TPA: hypothetical protein VGK19_13690 [Capsulimonadaceae bacterium]|jgi:hypothetical protein
MATMPNTLPTQSHLMRLDADLAWRELLDALDGLDERQAWALPRMHGTGDLATRGSIIEIVQHLAVCKFMYASSAFHASQYGWDDCFARIREMGSDWKANLEYLHEAQGYWMSSWSHMDDDDMVAPRMTNWGAQWPTWRIVSTISHHDSYHAGQVTLLRAVLAPTDTPCPTHADYSLATLDVKF